MAKTKHIRNEELWGRGKNIGSPIFWKNGMYIIDAILYGTRRPGYTKCRLKKIKTRHYDTN